jgi:hypothetical protein
MQTDAPTLTQAVTAEEGEHFEIHEHNDYNEEGNRKITLYSWQVIVPTLYGQWCECNFTDRDDCEANAVEKLTAALAEGMEDDNDL